MMSIMLRSSVESTPPILSLFPPWSVSDLIIASVAYLTIGNLGVAQESQGDIKIKRCQFRFTPEGGNQTVGAAWQLGAKR
jgi:hypothetical protein